MAQQLAFDLPADVQLGAENFFVSDANQTAFTLVRAPHSWPDGKLSLVGPSGCGKTHLAKLFATQNNAMLINAQDIVPDAPLPDVPTVIEDGENLHSAAEEWVFHTHNHLRASGIPLLVTGRPAPARWNIALPLPRSTIDANARRAIVPTTPFAPQF